MTVTDPVTDAGSAQSAAAEPCVLLKEGEIWLKGGAIKPYASTLCTLGALNAFASRRQAIDVAYVFDHARGIKLFADEAYYAVGSRTEVVSFMLKADAQAYAARASRRRPLSINRRSEATARLAAAGALHPPR